MKKSKIVDISTSEKLQIPQVLKGGPWAKEIAAGDIVKTTVRLPRALWQAARMMAIENRRTFESIMTEGLAAQVVELENEKLLRAIERERKAEEKTRPAKREGSR